MWLVQHYDENNQIYSSTVQIDSAILLRNIGGPESFRRHRRMKPIPPLYLRCTVPLISHVLLAYVPLLYPPSRWAFLQSSAWLTPPAGHVQLQHLQSLIQNNHLQISMSNTIVIIRQIYIALRHLSLFYLISELKSIYVHYRVMEKLCLVSSNKTALHKPVTSACPDKH